MAVAPALSLLKTFRDPFDAYFLRGRLEAEGIPAFVFNDQHVYVSWMMSTALGGVRVMVPTHLEDDAQAVWESVVAGDCEATLARMFGDIDAPRCPHCGATDIRHRNPLPDIMFGVVLVLATGIPIKVTRTRCTCRVCGTTWNED